MMEAGMYLARGLFIGLIFGVPAGVIGVLTIKRTLEHGFWAGTVTGFGSAAADLIYGCIGVCGLTAVSDRLISLEQPIRVCGGAAIGLYGLMTLRRAIQGRNIQADAYATEEEPKRAVCPDPQVQTTPGRYSLLFLSTFLIAVTNPATILAFVTAFASFGILGGVTLGQGCCLLLGLAGGTGSWWIFLAWLTCRFRGRIHGNVEAGLHGILGGLMVLFGIGAIAGGIL